MLPFEELIKMSAEGRKHRAQTVPAFGSTAATLLSGLSCGFTSAGASLTMTVR